jgi:hypothetical protein
MGANMTFVEGRCNAEALAEKVRSTDRHIAVTEHPEVRNAQGRDSMHNILCFKEVFEGILGFS